MYIHQGGCTQVGPEIPNLMDGFAMTKNRNRFIFNFSKFFNSFSLQNDSLRSKMSHYPLLWKWVTIFFLLKKRKMSFLAGLGITSEKPPIVIEFGTRYTKAGFSGESGIVKNHKNPLKNLYWIIFNDEKDQELLSQLRKIFEIHRSRKLPVFSSGYIMSIFKYRREKEDWRLSKRLQKPKTLGRKSDM